MMQGLCQSIEIGLQSSASDSFQSCCDFLAVSGKKFLKYMF